MFSIICVYNNRDIFQRHLLKSLQAQTAAFELIALDNTRGAYRSAARALNDGANRIQADSRYILFAHQDIELGSPDWLAQAEAMLAGLPALGIAGVAGKQDGSDTLLTNITDGIPPRKPGQEISAPVAALALDECCAMVPRHVFLKHRFDERLCGNWHLYVVEYCLRLKEVGLAAYVLPLELYHCSTGTLNSAYFKTLKKIMKAYGDRYPVLYTTCGCWDSRTSLARQWWWPVLKKYFYACTGRLIASGLVPEWLQRKKNKRLKTTHMQSPAP